MLHEARMNFQRTIVNQAPRFPCRGAAQFNLRLRLTLAEENHRWTQIDTDGEYSKPRSLAARFQWPRSDLA